MADFKGLIDKLKSLLAGNKDKVQDAAKGAVEKVEGATAPKDGDAQ